jgi:Uma2 family endonuclease
MSPPGARHGNLQVRIGAALWTQGEAKGHGTAYTEVGIVLERNPDHVLGPDAAFVRLSSLPARVSSEGYLDTIPEIVVEIRSKNDSAAEIAEKVNDYLQAGVRVVWVADPAAETTTEYRPNSQARTLRRNESLQCPDIIPGFELPLADLFRE